MNKKQAGIIVTLLALIVCAGILAARVNGPLEVNTMDDSVFNFNTDKKENTTTSDFFTTNNLQRDQDTAQVLAQYKALIEDSNVSAESKKEAEKKYTLKTENTDKENTIEMNLKANGFADAICLISDNKAQVIVKAKEVTDKQVKQIKDIVNSVAKINNVEISAKE
jgi:stage III sporulation protein AH